VGILRPQALRMTALTTPAAPAADGGGSMRAYDLSHRRGARFTISWRAEWHEAINLFQT
jgi:hypothetical protein